MYNFAVEYLKKQQQFGGRVAMPLEYFGVDSGAFTDAPKFSSQAPTNAAAVPALKAGGGTVITKSAFQKEVRRAKETLGVKRVGGGVETMFKAYMQSAAGGKKKKSKNGKKK